MNEISKAMPFKLFKLKFFHYAFLFSPKCSKIAICSLLEMNYCVEGDRPRHAIVYIPTVVQGKIYEITQAKMDDLKPFAQKCFLIFKQVGV